MRATKFKNEIKIMANNLDEMNISIKPIKEILMKTYVE